MYHNDTIVAQASPPGRGGVSLIRISGENSLEIAGKLFQKHKTFFKERVAQFVNCYSSECLVDEGLSIYFKNPKSFTGEDVIEFQCHGSPIVVDKVIKEATLMGARIAKPGEFSERAFLNGKIDLVQAEAIADLIDSQSNQAAKNALQTLKGVFSEKINSLNEALIKVRMYLEAAIDFPDEEGVDFIGEGKIKEKVTALSETLYSIRKEAEQGQILQEGMSVVLAGEPNAGKSSLLNRLAQKESAIVTEVAGTTRDVLKEHISIHGLALNIIDTAGLRESLDLVEQEGIRRAWAEIESADLILYLVESPQLGKLEKQSAWQALIQKIDTKQKTEQIVIVENKIDLSEQQPSLSSFEITGGFLTKAAISAKQNEGVEELKTKITEIAGLSAHQESKFTARRRHIDALDQAKAHLDQALAQFEGSLAAELLAEDLRLSHACLGEITGEFSSDDLLGEIFSGFCIGK